MELFKDILRFGVFPFTVSIFRFFWIKISQIEKNSLKCPGLSFCQNEFARKSEIATKQDISDLLDAKFERFELRLINEGRIMPVKKH